MQGMNKALDIMIAIAAVEVGVVAFAWFIMWVRCKYEDRKKMKKK